MCVTSAVAGCAFSFADSFGIFSVEAARGKIRDVKFVRLDLVSCEIFCDIAIGRTKLFRGPMSVGLASFAVTGAGFLIAVGAFG